MDTIKDGYIGLSLLANLNWDRFLFLGLSGVALFAAGFLMTP
jgi:hypothetical protein